MEAGYGLEECLFGQMVVTAPKLQLEDHTIKFQTKGKQLKMVHILNVILRWHIDITFITLSLELRSKF